MAAIRKRKAAGSTRKKTARVLKVPEQAKKAAQASLDLGKLPPESVTKMERGICLACVWTVFTRHLGLAPRTALLEIKRYTPSLSELGAAAVTRPYVTAQVGKEPCPYCGASSKWVARLPIYRIESGKATDVLRRELVKSLPSKDGQFIVLEQKATQQKAFFEWLETVSRELDLADPGWMREVSRHYLSRKEPKVDWQTWFGGVRSIRRSRRLEEGWEVERPPLLFADVVRRVVAGAVSVEPVASIGRSDS